MYTIIGKQALAEGIHSYTFDAPLVAANAHPGQFVMLRVSSVGERIPLTICDYDNQRGTVTVAVQSIGYTTHKLAQLAVGDSVSDLVGPLGMPTDLSAYQRIALVGGGIGTAVIYPQAKLLASQAKPADVIIGARNRSLILFEQQFAQCARQLLLTTDDGSYVRRGFVTDVLRERLDQGAGYDCVFAVGPLPMMRAVAQLTREYDVHTVISMNSLMVDGTGMCGCCRLTVGGVTRYACVDGPEFDGHLVDFDEAISRSRQYRQIEAEHMCRLNR